jgi:hypothetical protein
LTLPWEEAGWEEAVATWINETLAELQVERVGPVDHFRRRPWAALARVTTAEGDAYFKADPPSEAYEPALTQWLARARPDVVPKVLRIDTAQGWLLTRDAGANLFDQITDPPDLAIWSELLPLCAELQLELAGSTAEFLALGVPDTRPTLLGQAYEDLLSRWPAATGAPAATEIARLIEGSATRFPPRSPTKSSRTTTSCFAMAPRS